MAMRVGPPLDTKQAILEAYAINEQMNQILLAGVDQRAWRAPAPGYKDKCIATIFAHLHNARVMWLKITGRELKVRIPAQVDRARCTKKQVADALARSAESLSKVLEAGLSRPDGRVKDFRPHAAGFFLYIAGHDFHHRGQILMLYRQLGYRFADEAAYGIWNWGKIWKKLGFER